MTRAPVVLPWLAAADEAARPAGCVLRTGRRRRDGIVPARPCRRRLQRSLRGPHPPPGVAGRRMAQARV